LYFYFFFQAEDGIRDFHVTGVQTCALPIVLPARRHAAHLQRPRRMDPAPPPGHPPQALETGSNHLPGTAQPRSLGSRSPAGGGQWPALVEKLRDAHQRGLSHPLLRRAGGPPARRVTSTLRTARCGPACRVVWQGSRGITSGPYADCTEIDEAQPQPARLDSSLGLAVA